MNPDTSSDANRPCMIPIDFNEEIIAAAAAMLPAEYHLSSPSHESEMKLPLPNPKMPQLIYVQKPFADHTGQGGLSIYRGRVRHGQSPLLNPWSWQIYVTYGATATDCGDLPLVFYNSLIDQLSAQTLRWFRLDFLFLPGANAQACARYYCSEKSARAGGELEMVPSYAGGNASWLGGDVLVLWDRQDWAQEGVGWVPFHGEKEEEEEGRRVVERVRTIDHDYVPEMAWVGERIEELERQSRIKKEWEAEYFLAKELMES